MNEAVKATEIPSQPAVVETTKASHVEQPQKAQPKKIQKPEARRQQQQQQQVKSEIIELSFKTSEPESSSKPNDTSDIKSETTERSQNIITPGPTPTPFNFSSC